MMLNAGRGNPNWVATTPREGFFQLGRFAIEESQRMLWRPQVGGIPIKEGIANRFEEFVAKKKGDSGTTFLQDAFVYVRDELGIEPDEFVSEMTDAILGDYYPMPDRMLTCSEKIVHKYLEQEMYGGAPPPGRFDLFPTEGGTAAIDYIFTTLMENKLLHKGDTIALGDADLYALYRNPAFK